MKYINSGKNLVKIWTNDIEKEAEEQLLNLSNLPFIYKHIAVMPDVHAGKGSTIGTVIATKGAVCPATVGVDLGCGMTALKLPFKVDVIMDKLLLIRHSIERAVPVGFNKHSMIDTNRGSILTDILGDDLTCFDKDRGKLLTNAGLQLGTLGGGNHFIEICFDENADAWIVLHTGSRNIGKMIAEVHINKAKGLMKSYFIDLPDPDLSYLVQNTLEFDNYIHDINWAQKYAYENREHMLKNILAEIAYYAYGDKDISRFDTCLKISCHHNYTTMENHFNKNVLVTRKGAVSAKLGQLGIIPGSMGDKSYIVEGLGNIESFCSCSHGAGRRMSRNKAKSIFTIDDLIKQTSNVECRKDADIIDEIPGAYKNIDEVMDNQKDLVKILHTLKQIICIKG